MFRRRPPKTYTRTKFCFRWRGRRWYDPNERKVVWGPFCLMVATTLVRMLILGDLFSQSRPLAAAPVPVHGVVGTVHDLSASGPNHVTQSKDVCSFCHLPQGNPAGLFQSIPIWNHETTQQQFTSYSSSSIQGMMNAQPAGPSLVCLSCHDGTVAVGALHELPVEGGQDNYSQSTGGVSSFTGMMEGPAKVGSNLSSGHPISIAYRDDRNRDLRPPSELQGVRLFPSNTRGSKVECGSCHDPHNFGIPGSTAPFLRVTKQGSALCFSCHIL